MTNTFKQLNHRTDQMYTVVIHDTVRWYSYIRLSNTIKTHDTLADFQDFFGCSDEELAVIKLTYGEPIRRLYRKIRVT